jgi:isoquinoline 1-oxidoreductase
MIEPERYELSEAPPYRFTASRREMIGVTGAGLLFVLNFPADAQAPAGRESRIHVGDDGTYTVFTGKIEEGQGARTELAMAAAEELRVPLDKVRVVTADTDLTPNDGTTAGSRTTPSTVPAVRKAAAAVRDAMARLTPPNEWKVLGKPQPPVNARNIVTGAHKYPSDVTRPGMLYGCVLRPPSFGATLESVDTKAAEAVPGAVVVRDGDFAGCAAPSSYAARKAVDALAAKASWKTKPHPSSKVLFEHLRSTAQRDARGAKPQVHGDPDAALEQAARRLKATYTTPYIQHAPMEPRAALAEWSGSKLTVWTGTSNPFSVRDQLSQAFRIPASSVRVIVPDMGGGFGGKHTGEAAVEAARLAKAAGKPVSLRWTRAEEFTWAYSRPAALIDVEGGLDAKGAITAWVHVNINSGGSALASPYRLANSRHQFIPADSPLRQGSYRCLAATANNFARESFMDELAAAAGADPLAFRLAHLDNQRIKDVLNAAAEKFRWAKRSKEKRPGRGVGLACGTEKNSVVAACVEIEIDPRTSGVRLLEICEAFECGPILNPLGLRSQVEGCIIMGLGAALREELLFENGALTNGHFHSYKVPRFRDVPKMDLIFLERKNLEPAGAGETPIIAVAPAMCNAVFHATGERLRSLPLRLPARKS